MIVSQVQISRKKGISYGHPSEKCIDYIARSAEFSPHATRRHRFDRWMFNTSQYPSLLGSANLLPLSPRSHHLATPYALLQVNDAPVLLMNARTWPFPQPLGTGTPFQSIWMPGRVIPIPNPNSVRACLHRSVEVVVSHLAKYFSPTCMAYGIEFNHCYGTQLSF
jgi:hypothetical protein